MSVFYQSKILQTPTEEMQDGGSVKPRKMFRGGMGGFELPENLQELIGYAPSQNRIENVVEDEEPAPQFGPFQGKKRMDAFKADSTLTPAQLARQREDLALRPEDVDKYGLSPYSGLPTTEGAAEWLYGGQNPYYDTIRNACTSLDSTLD